MAESHWAAIEQRFTKSNSGILLIYDTNDHLRPATDVEAEFLVAVGEAKRRESELEARLKQASGYVTEEFTEWADETAAHLDTKARAAELERALTTAEQLIGTAVNELCSLAEEIQAQHSELATRIWDLTNEHLEIPAREALGARREATEANPTVRGGRVVSSTEANPSVRREAGE